MELQLWNYYDLNDVVFDQYKILSILYLHTSSCAEKQYSAQIKMNYNPRVIQNLSRQYDAFAIQLNEIPDK